MPPAAKVAKAAEKGSKRKTDDAAKQVPAAKRIKSGTTSDPAAEATVDWKTVGTVWVCEFGSSARRKIAGFDLDWTLVKTSSGKAVATSRDDWELFDPSVTPKLQSLHRDGYKVVVIMNQVGLTKGSPKAAELLTKVVAVQAAAGIPMLVLVPTASDRHLKPLSKCWDLIEHQFNGGMKVLTEESFFCGDAAGRKPPVVKAADSSASDLKFALNVGIQFFTPEELFLGQKKSERASMFDPRVLGLDPTKFPALPMEKQVVILCVGAPGSGKSSVATIRFKDYVRVNQDTLKTKDKCIQACQEALSAGKSVIVDNQNKTKGDRLPYLSLAKKAGVSAIALFFDVPKELCFHLNAYRLLHSGSALHRAEKVPSSVIQKFFQMVQEPTTGEGFEDVFRVGLEHFSVEESDADVPLLRAFIV